MDRLFFLQLLEHYSELVFEVAVLLFDEVELFLEIALAFFEYACTNGDDGANSFAQTGFKPLVWSS